MFPRLRVGPVCVRVEVNVSEVDTAPFGDRADPPIRTDGFCGGGSFVPGSGQAGDGIHGHTQVNRLASGPPGPSVVIEFNAKGHGPEVDAWEGGAQPGDKRKAPPVRAGLSKWVGLPDYWKR